jgi:mannose-6-phosphate isomerase-like protein (cupin superfamily)
MTTFVTRHLSSTPDAMAPDGSEVRILAATRRGSMAHFTLPAGQVSQAVAHRTVEEVWYFVAGTGHLWRKNGGEEETIAVHPGISISIPVGTYFQFRADGDAALEALGVTMPPWPGPDEAYKVAGIWEAATGAIEP